MKMNHGNVRYLLVFLLSLYFTMGIALAANSPKTVLCVVKKSDGATYPAAADTVIKVTDESGEISTYSNETDPAGRIAYDESGGVINISLGNFTEQWAAEDTIKVEVTSGTAGSAGFEFGERTGQIDAKSLQKLDDLTLIASQRNMIKSAGDVQTQVYGTELATALEVTVVDDLGAPVAGVTPTASGDGTITAFTETDLNGKSNATWTLGPGVGAQTMTVTLAGYPNAVFTATATAGPLASYTVSFTAFNATAGAANNITVTAKDADGNTITDHTGTIAVTATDDNAELPADYTFAAGDNGVTTLSVKLKTAGEQTITVTNGDISGTVDGTVFPAAAAKIDLTASATTVASDGIGTADLKATVQDAFGNTVKTEAGDVTYTVTGTDTSNAGWTNETATLTDGVATKEFTTQGTVGGDGSVVVTVTATKAVLTNGTIDLTIVNFSVAPANTPMAKIEDKINLKVEGALGNVTWEVTGDPDVGSLVTSGNNNENAVFTVNEAGTAKIKVTEGQKESTATVTAYDDVAVTNKDEFDSVPSGETVEFKVSGGDKAVYTWTITPPNGVPTDEKIKDETGIYSFKAPTNGNFAGTYKIEVTDNVGFGKDSFEIYVPLQLKPDLPRVTLLSNANPYPFTLAGAADGTPYTRTVDSIDDVLPDEVKTGKFGELVANKVTYAFDPQAYTVTADTGAKEYSLGFDVQGLTNPDLVDIRVAPATLFSLVKVDDKTGGEQDFTATAPKDVQDMFGTNPIKLKIARDSSGKTIEIAVREPVKFEAKSGTVTSGIIWEIIGLESDTCVTIPVPCTEAEAREANAGTKAVYYLNDKAGGVWKKVDLNKIVNIKYAGNNSLIEVEICEWSSNVVGIGAVSSSGGGSATPGSSSDSDCFISSLDGNSNFAWLAMIAILAVAGVFTVARRHRIH